MAGALSVLSACQGWKTDNRPVPSVVQNQQDGKVAVRLNNLDWVILHNPTIENDSIFGMRTQETTFGASRTALPLERVRSIETRQFSLRRTVGLAVAVALLPLFYLAAFVEPE